MDYLLGVEICALKSYLHFVPVFVNIRYDDVTHNKDHSDIVAS